MILTHYLQVISDLTASKEINLTISGEMGSLDATLVIDGSTITVIGCADIEETLKNLAEKVEALWQTL